MMPFLYFPEDKSEYIPAIIMLGIIIVAAGVALYFFYKNSKKQEKKFDLEYKNQLEKQNKPH
ncbi:FeoB-associated Cys-rich membrane protein [Paucisalibacillus sp. EB02]|uniref:FeoB-associated Cys-rich membrane protein n=1 Tax=Paucisalibacillus sp. EB02 TaxID=1347087 RepID=UPI0004BAB999|nr:FeoB-associated Cys-rich membrane protein [Paucisalibacillus sp. EB02]